jgi:HAD superfamily hydrolase (TIGR01509 family)
MHNLRLSVRPSLVIFDCDGVLVDSEPIANAVFAEHLAKIGIVLSIEQTMARFMGRSMKSCIEDVAAELRQKKLPEPANFPEDFLNAMQFDTFEALQTQLQPVAGIAAAIDAIEAQGMATCIASSGDHGKMKITLGKTALLDRFGGRIYSATQVAKGKPAPDLFLFAAAQMGFPPSQCVVVEDSPFGVEAAVAAGMRAMAYCALTNFNAMLARPGVQDAARARQVREFHSMDMLPGLLSI